MMVVGEDQVLEASPDLDRVLPANLAGFHAALRDLGETRLAATGSSVEEHATQFRKAPGLADDDTVEVDQPRREDETHEANAETDQIVTDRLSWAHRWQVVEDRHRRPLTGIGDERAKQLLLGAEVVVKGALRTAEPRRDLRHRCCGVALRNEHLARHIKDGAPPGVAAG